MSDVKKNEEFCWPSGWVQNTVQNTVQIQLAKNGEYIKFYCELMEKQF